MIASDTLQYFSITNNSKEMAKNKNDQDSQQPAGSSVQQSIQHSSDSDLSEMNIKVQEIEEWDVVITDQRRPQFRSEENYRRRNF